MSGNKEVDQVGSNASSTGLRALEKAPKTSRSVVSETLASDNLQYPSFPETAGQRGDLAQRIRRRVVRQRVAELVLIADDYSDTLPAQDPRLSKLFGLLNDEYFEGLLPEIPILRGIPDPIVAQDRLHEWENSGATLIDDAIPGDHGVASIVIYLNESLFRPSLFKDEHFRWEWLADVLIHQMAEEVARHLDRLGAVKLFEHEGGLRNIFERSRIRLRDNRPKCNCKQCGLATAWESDGWPGRLQPRYERLLSCPVFDALAIPGKER